MNCSTDSGENAEVRVIERVHISSIAEKPDQKLSYVYQTERLESKYSKIQLCQHQMIR